MTFVNLAWPKRAAAMLLLLASSALDAQPLRLHVASPDWRAQIIYFAMIDRFDDGDPTNNRQSANDFDPNDHRKYSGGDLVGLTRRLDYIQGLGATTLWITPPVAHQWWDGAIQYGGYHGYWAENFARVDAHFGDLRDYQRLADGLHRKGMYLVQDIVVNHTGNYLRYPREWDAADPTVGVAMNTQSEPPGPPSQKGLELNDPRNPLHRAQARYHFTPTIRDFNDPLQERTFQLADLDDLNTRNPEVRRLLRRSYGDWIKRVGVDGFRVDTAFYVEPDFFEDFLHSKDPQAPGVLAVARATGRVNFHLFGEGFATDRPFEDSQAKKIERYMTAENGQPLLPGMLNFPLYGSTLDVFARAQPTAILAARIASMQALHRQIGLMPSFVDNHDVERFLTTGDEDGLRQALLLIMTLPGIPVIYYGTEQGFKIQRQALFKGGFAANGRDHFAQDSALYRYIARVSQLRRAHVALTHGTPRVLQSNAAGAGLLAYRMQSADQQLLVVFNSAGARVLVDRLSTGLPAHSTLVPEFSIDPTAARTQVVDQSGALTLELAPRSGVVWRVAAPRADKSVNLTASIQLDPLLIDRVRDDFVVSGMAPGMRQVQLVVDGALGSALISKVDATGRFSGQINTQGMFDPAIEHQVVAYSKPQLQVSAPLRFRVNREWQLLAEQADPAGDDHGPTGTYQYPNDPGWADRQLDLRSARLYRSGAAWRLDVQTAAITRAWNPPNDFDHVALTVYFALPGRKLGARMLPLQNASMPNGMRWHYRLRAGGFSNAWFSASGASASQEGTLSIPGARIQTDQAQRTISFLLPPGAFGAGITPDHLSAYVTTWDYDADYRALQPQAGPYQFGGANANAPKVMDDLLISSGGVGE